MEPQNTVDPRNSMMHLVLKPPEDPTAYAWLRFFIDFSSAFNTIQPFSEAKTEDTQLYY